jgi:hypothetical protein
LDAWKPALSDFEKAVALDSANGEAYVSRGLARVMLGDYRSALADAAEAKRRHLDTPEMMHNLACLYAQASGRVRKNMTEPDRKNLAQEYCLQAVQAVRQSLALVPAKARETFFRDKILPDSALDPIRDSPEFQQIMKDNSSKPMERPE